jgi:hypothetical protein
MFMRVAVSRGCPQGGVLSPLLWCLVVDDLMSRFSMDGEYCQGYADDICLLAVGKFPNTVSELMQGALHTVEKRCLSVNPDNPPRGHRLNKALSVRAARVYMLQ